jgi:nucleoside-diphosphate-sugar epimerase
MTGQPSIEGVLFVGSAIVQELMKAGHQVLGLARSDGPPSLLQPLVPGLAKHYRLTSLSSRRNSADYVLTFNFSSPHNP